MSENEKRMCKNCGKEIELKDGVWYHLTGYKICNTIVAQPERCSEIVEVKQNKLLLYELQCILWENHSGKHIFEGFTVNNSHECFNILNTGDEK